VEASCARSSDPSRFLLGLPPARRRRRCRNQSGRARTSSSLRQVCDPGRTDPCRGIYWKEKDGDFRATSYQRLIRRCTTSSGRCPGGGGHLRVPVVPEGSQQCYLQHTWQVDCNTFCFHEDLNPSARTARPHLDRQSGGLGLTDYLGGRCQGTAPATSCGPWTEVGPPKLWQLPTPDAPRLPRKTQLRIARDFTTR